MAVKGGFYIIEVNGGGIKMKRIIFIGIFIIITFSISSLIFLNAQWAISYGSYEPDTGYSVQETSDGGYIIVGFTESFGAGKADIWILKLNSDGEIEWQKTYGGDFGDEAYSIQQTIDGGYIVGGITESFGKGKKDFWVLKLSSSGTIEWQKTYGGSGNDIARAIQQTSDGGYIITGLTESFGAGDYDIWILKLSPNGNIEWQKTYGDDSVNASCSIQQTNDGGYIVAGYTIVSNTHDMWVLKLSSSGNIEWQKTYGGNKVDSAISIRQTNDGGYIVAGFTESFGAGGKDIWILKLNPDGEIEWQKTYGSYYNDVATSIQQTNDGGYIIGGSTENVFIRGIYGKANFLILKLTPLGDIEWQKIYGGQREDRVLSIQQTMLGEYIVAGYTSSYGSGWADFWVLQLSSQGDIDPSCGFIRNFNAVDLDTSISPLNTKIFPVNTSIIPIRPIFPQKIQMWSQMCCVEPLKRRKLLYIDDSPWRKKMGKITKKYNLLILLLIFILIFGIEKSQASSNKKSKKWLNRVSIYGGINCISEKGSESDYIRGENDFPVTPSHTTLALGLAYNHYLFSKLGLELNFQNNRNTTVAVSYTHLTLPTKA